MALNFAELVELIGEKILTGGRRTKAVGTREALTEIARAATVATEGASSIILICPANNHRIKFTVGEDCMLIQPGEDLDA